jgi:hypothetical protein
MILAFVIPPILTRGLEFSQSVRHLFRQIESKQSRRESRGVGIILALASISISNRVLIVSQPMEDLSEYFHSKSLSRKKSQSTKSHDMTVHCII